MGLSPGTVITGTPIINNGGVARQDASVFAASATQAWNVASQEGATPMGGTEIGGSTFTKGIWHAGYISIATGKTVTLDGEGDPNSTFLFQSATTMVVAAGCKIVLINGAKAENVVWALRSFFTSGAGTDFKGSIMAGTQVTFEAGNVIEGSILATDAITFGAQNKVNNGCVISLAALTFGTENTVTFVPALDTTAVYEALIDNEQFTIACARPVCDTFSIDDDMQTMLNECTQQGIINTGVLRRRVSENDTSQFEGDIVIAPTATLDEGAARRARALQGVGQKERKLQLDCDILDEDAPLIHIMQCCIQNPLYCGSPKGDRRRELQATISGTTVAQMEQDLPSISKECSIQFQALAHGYLEDNPDATCFAAASDVENLKCHAILVTDGFSTTANAVSEIPGFQHLTGFHPFANVNDEFIIACISLTHGAPTPVPCKTLPIHDAMQAMLNDCTQQVRRRTSGIDIPHLELLGNMAIAPTATLDEDVGRGARTLQEAGQEERRLLTCSGNPPLIAKMQCCWQQSCWFCGSPKSPNRRRESQTTPSGEISAAEVEEYLPSISEECTSQLQTLAAENPTCFAAVNEADLICDAIFMTEGSSEV